MLNVRNGLKVGAHSKFDYDRSWPLAAVLKNVVIFSF